MKIILVLGSFILLLISCNGNEKITGEIIPEKKEQWLNPVFFNNDFEHELNFPLWFSDSFVRQHEIYKITKRIYPRIIGDTSEINSYNQAIPKEKIEYYFDQNGLVDQIVVYSYFDDREISRAYFVYEGNMYANGYRKVRVLPFISLSKNVIKDEFTTDFYQDKTHQFSFFSILKIGNKYSAFADLEKGNNLFVLKKRKFWNPLSVDSILHPNKEDWIILGTIRKPYKRYHVENMVKETSVYTYEYWKSGQLKSRVKTVYPFEYHRSFLYDKKNNWVAYIDSTFSEGKYITNIQNNIIFDEFERPIEISHHKSNDENSGYFYKETLHYRTKKNKNEH